MSEKLTLKLGTKVNLSSKDGVVEVIKKRRTFTTPLTSVSTTDEKQDLLDAKADKLKDILANAKKIQTQSKLEAEKNAKLEEKRKFLIADELDKKESEPPKSQEVAKNDENVEKQVVKKHKKDEKYDEFNEKEYKFSKKDTSKINFSDVVVSKSDLDFEDLAEEEGDISSSLTSAIDVIAGYRHRRSVASIKRQKAKNYRKFMEKQEAKEIQKTYHEVLLPETISVKDLSVRMAEKSADVIKVMMKMGIMATINQIIDADTAELIVMEMGHSVKRVSDEEHITSILSDEGEEKLELRPPVITVMGHVDHGKTSLLDALRNANVVSKEAGGITQHIGAYQILSKLGRKITFIDTPGHEAFSSMRARGVNITDIVILVVAANDGIMPQTIEAINHAKAAKVPLIVAINKIDLPEANPEKVRMDLLQQGLVVEKLGGDILDVEISAKKQINLDKLEELLLLQADMLELKGNILGNATGAVIEARMEQGKGAVATILVQKGTLKKGDIFVSGSVMGKVREMFDEYGNKVDLAYPSQPVVVLGFDNVPESGDDFVVVDNEAKARDVVNYRILKQKQKKMALKKSSWQDVFDDIKEGKAKTLSVIVKADTQGSAEAISESLIKIESDKVNINVVHSAVGAINESDISLAKNTGAVIIAFNVRANNNVKEQAKSEGIDIRYYSIIYNIIDDVKVLMSGLLAPVIKENFIGYADVLQTFKIGKIVAAGCKVVEGVVKKGCGVRMLRDNIVIYEGKLAQLKKEKDDVKEVRLGTECGISFDNFNDIKVGDKLECYETEEIEATL